MRAVRRGLSVMLAVVALGGAARVACGQIAPEVPAAPAGSPAVVPAPVPVNNPPVAPAVDAAPGVVPVDTVHRAGIVGIQPEVPEKVTQSLALRIVGAIAVLTLTTLLLYNVRSR